MATVIDGGRQDTPRHYQTVAAPRAVTLLGIELPYDERGNVDWSTLGNILTAHILGEVLHASYVDHRYGQQSADFSVETGWQITHEEHEVIVLRKRIPDSPFYCFMGRGVIDLPLKQVAEFIGNPKSTFIWDKHLKEIKFIEALSRSDHCEDHVLYMKHEAQNCIVKVKRDFLYYTHCLHKDGKYIQTVISVDHPDCPPMPGVTRGYFHPGTGWVLEPYRGSSSRTLVNYLAHVDLVGLPPVITNRVLGRHPFYIHSIRQHLMITTRILQPSTYSKSKSREEALTQSSPLYSSLSGMLYEESTPISTFMGMGKRSPRRRCYSILLESISPDQSVLEFGAIPESYETLGNSSTSTSPEPRLVPVIQHEVDILEFLGSSQSGDDASETAALDSTHSEDYNTCTADGNSQASTISEVETSAMDPSLLLEPALEIQYSMETSQKFVSDHPLYHSLEIVPTSTPSGLQAIAENGN